MKAWAINGPLCRWHLACLFFAPDERVTPRNRSSVARRSPRQEITGSQGAHSFTTLCKQKTDRQRDPGDRAGIVPRIFSCPHVQDRYNRSMDPYQYIGWIGNVGFVLGAYAMANKRPVRFAYFNLVGNLCYSTQSIAYENWSLLALSLILGTLNVVTVKRWK